jgi:hypothetical protein
MGTEDIDKLRETSAAPRQKMEFGADQLQQDESRWTNQIGPVNLGERENQGRAESSDTDRWSPRWCRTKTLGEENQGSGTSHDAGAHTPGGILHRTRRRRKTPSARGPEVHDKNRK